jgi:argininosuccinate synthase
MHLSDAFISKYSELVYNGFWFSPEREAVQALVTETQRDVTGVARLKLYKGASSLQAAKARRASMTQRSRRWNPEDRHMIKATPPGSSG